MPGFADPFCAHLAAELEALDAALRLSLPIAERSDALKLVAGLKIVRQAVADDLQNTPELNAVVRRQLGNGFSWFTCVQFLSGARARDAFARQRALLQPLVDPVLFAFAERALPEMGEMLRTMPTLASSS